MAVYKEVDELLKAMDTWDKFGVSFGLFKLNKSNEKDYIPYVRYEDMVQAVTGTPHADVAPVVHAYWKPSILPLIQIDWFRCSNCNANAIQTPFDIPAKTDYCPFCGARMDGEKEG